MKRFGVTTISRWLGEELPPGVSAYLEYQGKLFELLRVEGGSGKLSPILKTLATRFRDFRPRMFVTLDTPVILSTHEELAGVLVTKIKDDLAPAASNSWAFNSPQERLGCNQGTTPDVNKKIFGMYCG